MLLLPGPPLILEVCFSMRVNVDYQLSHYHDVKGAFVGSPFLASKNQNCADCGSDRLRGHHEIRLDQR